MATEIHRRWAEIESLLRDAIQCLGASLDSDTVEFLNELIENREFGLASEILVEQSDSAPNEISRQALTSVSGAQQLMGMK